MPRLIPPGEGAPITLGELVEVLDRPEFDPRDEDCFAAHGAWLARLDRNRTFLGDIVLAELETRCRGQARTNQYSAQVIMLNRSARYFIRANLWPAANDPIVRAGGEAPFFYGTAHDHNFSFLTVGHFGPGYRSDYWEYDHASVAGAPGEAVALRACGRRQLGPGELMLYRAGRDVHAQLAPDALSVTINIMQSTADQAFRHQYGFDTEGGRIDRILNRTPLETLLPLAATIGGEPGTALVTAFAGSHPSDRVRARAVAALADAAGDESARLAVLAEATASPRALVREAARARIADVERGRAWREDWPADGKAERTARAA